jgi:hypothetical protein
MGGSAGTGKAGHFSPRRKLHVAPKKTSRSPKSSTTPTDTTEAKAARPARSRSRAPQAAAEGDPAATAPQQAFRAKPTTRKSLARKVPARPAAGQAGPEINGGAPPGARHAGTDEDIRVRAYFLSLEYRGQGSDIDFWLVAERELRSRVGSHD